MNDDYPNSDGPSVVEFVFKHDDGREEVRHRFDYGSNDANEFIRKVEALKGWLGDRCLWSYRYV